MLSFDNHKYKPEPGQLCHVFKGKDNVYSIADSIGCLVSVPLEKGDIIMITKAEYHEELSSYYVEFMRSNRLFYTYFYEQIFCFEEQEDEILRCEEPRATFNYPWVICDE